MPAPPPPPPTPLPPCTRDYLIVLALLVAGWWVYGQTLGFPFISFDDPGYVYDNPHVKNGLSWDAWHWAWTSFERSNWHPLTWLSLQLDAQLYGLNAGGYHLTNLLLHLGNAVLLFVWLRTATGARWPAALTAFFFVAHPLHVESVAWVTERKDVLSTLFFFGTLLAYTRYAQSHAPPLSSLTTHNPQPTTHNPLSASYCLALLSFALGLTAKPMLVTLPPLLLLLDYWPLRRFNSGCRDGALSPCPAPARNAPEYPPAAPFRRLLLEKTPFFALAAASCVITVLAQRGSAMVPLGALPPTHRLASAALGYGVYLQKTFWPLHLGVYYPYWRAESLWWPVLWGVALAAISGTMVACRRTLPFALVGWCWFLGTLVPVIGVVQVGGQAVADRYAYLPHVGLFIALFWTAALLWQRRPSIRPTLLGLTAAAALACLTLAHAQTALWRDSLTLFQHTVRIAPPSTRLLHLLGDALLEAHRPAEARAAYEQAWRINPANSDVVPGLCALLLQENRYGQVVEILSRWRDDPSASADILNDLALALFRGGDPGKAFKVYRRCEQLHPEFAMAHFGIADVLRAQGDAAGSVAEDRAGLTLRDDWIPALTRLAWNYAHSDDPQLHAVALALARRAVALSEGRDLISLNALALAAAASGRWPEAVDAATAACNLATSPSIPPATLETCRTSLNFYRQGQLPSP